MTQEYLTLLTTDTATDAGTVLTPTPFVATARVVKSPRVVLAEHENVPSLVANGLATPEQFKKMRAQAAIPDHLSVVPFGVSGRVDRPPRWWALSPAPGPGRWLRRGTAPVVRRSVGARRPHRRRVARTGSRDSPHLGDDGPLSPSRRVTRRRRVAGGAP
jgi:hypothetical protein